MFLYNFIREALLSDVRASITVVHIRIFLKCITTSFDCDSSLEWQKVYCCFRNILTPGAAVNLLIFYGLD